MLNRDMSSSYSSNKVMVIYRINLFNMVLYIYIYIMQRRSGGHVTCGYDSEKDIFTRHIYWRKKGEGG